MCHSFFKLFVITSNDTKRKGNSGMKLDFLHVTKVLVCSPRIKVSLFIIFLILSIPLCKVNL